MTEGLFHSHYNNKSLEIFKQQSDMTWFMFGGERMEAEDQVGEFPCGPVAKTPHNECQETGFQSLLRELDPTDN